MSTSTSWPASTPAAARFSALSGSIVSPRYGVTVLRYEWPLIVTTTGNRAPRPIAATASAGTGMPVADFPLSWIVLRKRMLAP